MSPALRAFALLLLASGGLACGKYGPPVREPSVPPGSAAPAASPSAAAPAGEECKPEPEQQPDPEKAP
jgi:hypothetical protein